MRRPSATISPTVPDIAESLGDATARARDFANGVAEALPPIALQAREQITEQIAPRIAEALAAADERSAPTRREARRRGTAALSALRGEIPPRRSHRVSRAFLLLAAGAAAGAVAGLVLHRRQPEYRGAEAYPSVGSLPSTGATRESAPDEITLPENAATRAE